MALKDVVDSISDVDERFRGFYTERDGKYHLDDALKPEGGDKLDEFRTTNRTQFAKIEELTASLAAQQQAVEELKTNLAGKDKEVADVRQTEAERIAALEKRALEADANAAKATQTARAATLSDSLGKLGARLGVEDAALTRFSQVHASSFAFDADGVPYVVGEAGRPKLSDVNAGQRMTQEEYVTGALQAEKFWLKPSKGDGASGDGGSGGGAVKTITKSEAENNWNQYEKGIADGSVVVTP
jgi:hypothetical protein